MEVLIRWKMAAEGQPRDSYVECEEVMKKFRQEYGQWCKAERDRRRKANAWPPV